MITEKINLNGNWSCLATDANNQVIQYTGNVPGCIHTDLINNNIIDYDIFWRDNYQRCQWIEERGLVYSKEFDVENIAPHMKLVFEGLDTYCDVFLNNKHIGTCQNMFIKHEFEVGNLLELGKNRIEVVFRSPIFTDQFPKRPGAFTTERLYSRRIQCTYGWDWVARFVTMGIYKEVYLVSEEHISIKDLYIYTKEADADYAQVIAEISTENYEDGSILDIVILDPDGNTICHKKRYCEESFMKEYIDISMPKRWYPNGYGEQPLYHFVIKENENILYEEDFGIVVSRIQCKPDEEGSLFYEKCLSLKKTAGAEIFDHNKEFSGFELFVNGEGVMCKGANWVPCEPFPSAESKEKIFKILQLAKNAGVNMIRVWGGGIFEQDYFYHTCDKLGIMVTQDFLMACGSYPEEDSRFLEELKKEAKYVALRLRNHPCLMWWTGDNENAGGGNDTQTSFRGRKAALQAIFPILNKYDPHRRFLISSPWGGDVYASKTVGTTHNTQFLNVLLEEGARVEDYKEYFKEFLARFIAEEPSMGAAEISSLKRFMTEEDIFNSEDMWLHHTKGNPGLKRELYEYTKLLAENIFGNIKDGKDRLIKLQYLQYEWVRISMENVRRNKGFNNGIIYWMLNDCWPAASGWSLIDYYNVPKAGYYSFKRCAKPIVVSIDQEKGYLRVYVSNDSKQTCSLNLQIFSLNLKTDEKKEMLRKEIMCPAAASKVHAQFSVDNLDEESIWIAEIENGEYDDRAFYKFGRLKIEVVKSVDIIEKNETSILVKADDYTHIVHLEGNCEFEDNYFMLLPKEERLIKCVGDMDNISVAAYSLLV